MYTHDKYVNNNGKGDTPNMQEYMLKRTLINWLNV